jgi:hypothetical protein
MLGGYTWAVKIDEHDKVIHLDVYLFVSARRQIQLPTGETATVTMSTEMPWEGKAAWDLSAPDGWNWALRVPSPEYAEQPQVSPYVRESDFKLINIV